jgi:hypothetical protein
MVTELVLTFKDLLGAEVDEPLEFCHAMTAPEGFEVTGGQIFVENSKTNDLERFSFRIDRSDDGKPSLTILEDPNS